MVMFEDSMTTTTTMDNSLKETMISQEGVFREQVVELHRLYGIQRNLMESFGWKKMDEYDLWNMTSHSMFPNMIQKRPLDLHQLSNHHHYDVECPKESLNLSLCLRGGSGEAGSRQPWLHIGNHCHNPIIIDLEEPVLDQVQKKKDEDDDDDDSCIIIIQAASTSFIKGKFDLNKQPEDDDDDSSDRFFKNSIMDSNSSNISSSCSNHPERCIEDGNDPHSDNNNDNIPTEILQEQKETGSNRVVDLGILEAVESLMSISLQGTRQLEQKPERSVDSYELIVMNLEEEDNCVCVSSKGCEVIIEEKEECGIKLMKRGRRMKDFQKDVLPSMACLSRHEIREDVNIMEAVIKSREYKRIMKAKTTKIERDKWFAPVKRSKRSKLNYVGRKC